MRGLVVGRLLGGDLHAVLRVVHQALDAVVGVVGGRVDADAVAAGLADDQLLTPVTEDVGGETGRALGGVAGVVAVGGEEGREGAVLLHLGDGRGRICVAVEDLALEVAVPVAQEVDRRTAAGERVAGHIEHRRAAVLLIAPKLGAGVVRPDIVAAAAASVAVGIVMVEDDLLLVGIVEGDAVAGALLLVADIDLDAGIRRVEVADVHRVAVALLGGVVELAVVVDDGGAGDDLLLAVVVDVGGHGIVVAVAVGIGGGIGGPGVIHPELLELLVLHGIGRGGQTSVVAAAGHDAGMDAVQIGDRAPEAVHAVGLVAGLAPLGRVAAAGLIVDGIEGSAGGAVEEGIILRAGVDEAVAVTVVLGGIADDLAGAVLGAVSGLAGHLALAVEVEVPHEELRIVRTCADVHAEVDAPEAGAVQAVAVDEDIAGLALLGIVLGVIGIPLEEELVLAVPVHIAHGHVVRGVAAARLGELDVEIRRRGRDLAGVVGDALGAAPALHAVGVGCTAGLVEEAGRALGVAVVLGRAGVDLLAAAEEAELRVIRVRGEESPAHEHPAVRLDGADAAVEVLDDIARGLVIGGVIGSGGGYGQCSGEHRAPCGEPHRGREQRGGDSSGPVLLHNDPPLLDVCFLSRTCPAPLAGR